MNYPKRNLTMMTDLYQLTMMNNYFNSGRHEDIAVFDLFFRKNTKYVSYSVFAGLEQVIEYIKNLKFTNDDLKYLKSLNIFSEGFLEYLKYFRFTGNVYAMEEGSIVFPQEPLIRVEAPLAQAQLIETAMLTMINYQTLIASKASHVVNAAQGASVAEFGLRRAQERDAGFYGARATYIAGVGSTSNVLAGEKLGIPVFGTHSHSYVMSFDNELEAFMNFARAYPDHCLLLVDTYNTLESGIPNAIKTFDYLKKKGHTPKGIRLDSGDLAYFSKKAREMLDAAGHTEAKIFASGDLDEYVIADLIIQGARIDSYGVGTKLITGGDTPALGGVYKMSALQRNGEIMPKMKISDNILKMTYPGIKTVYRVYDKETNKAEADLIALTSEVMDENKPLMLYDPMETWKVKEVTNYYLKEMLVPIFEDGECVYKSPSLKEMQDSCKANLDDFWDEYRRLTKPAKYKVDLSDGLYDLRKGFLQKYYKNGE